MKWTSFASEYTGSFVMADKHPPPPPTTAITLHDYLHLARMPGVLYIL